MSEINDDISMLILSFRIRVPVGGSKAERSLSGLSLSQAVAIRTTDL